MLNPFLFEIALNRCECEPSAVVPILDPGILSFIISWLTARNE